MKKLITMIWLLAGLNSYAQISNQEGLSFKVDETIIKEVEEKISESELGTSFDDGLLIYETPLIGNYYENDSLEHVWSINFNS